MKEPGHTRKYLRNFWLIYAGGAVFVFLLFTLISYGVLGKMPSFEDLENPKSILASQVISSDGNVLGNYFFEENRTMVEYHQISPHMINAIVSIEDQRYYKHSGIDFKGLARVLVKSILLGQETGGGSTITQQFAKMLFPREQYRNPIKFAIRKFREWVIAVKLEKTFTKEEILTMYLNKFDYLNLAVGVETASRVYFSKSAIDLEPHEAAMLAALAKNPSLYNPLRFPERTLSRRNLVLEKMKDLGYLSREEAGLAMEVPLGLDFQRVDHKEGLATYFREYLRKVLTEPRPTSREALEAWESDPLRGFCVKTTKPDGTPYNLYRDGLRIFTTIDSRMQQYAEEAVVDHLSKDLQPSFEREMRRYRRAPFANDRSDADVERSMSQAMGWSERYRIHKREQHLSDDSIRILFNTPVRMRVFSWQGEVDTVMTPMDSIRYYKRFMRSAFMAIVPQTGEVRAYVGGPDYRYFQYDQIMQGKRQVGSVFKPIVYTLAMENKYSPCQTVPNVPVSIAGEFYGKEGYWSPEFSETEELDGQMITLRTGLAKSLNQISAWVIKQYNPEAVIGVARKVGIRSPIDPVYPICVGAVDLPVYEVAGAFTAFANKGIWAEPIMVTRIEDKNGNLLATFKNREEVAMSEETAYKMLYMMEGVTQPGGTGIRLRGKYQFTNPIAGKTGTTNEYADGWFVGIVPNLLGAAWTGAEDKTVHFTNHSLGQGSNMALPIWAMFMQKVYADSTLSVSKEPFERPATLTDPLDCGVSGPAQETKKPTRKRADFDEF